MHESTRTLSYLGAAAVSVLLAFFLATSNPKPPSDFSEVGKAFFPEFDVSTAKSLEVVSFSDSAMEPKIFLVEQKNNKWQILLDKRTNTYYPADGEDRLAKTATSVLVVNREQFVTKDPEQYSTLGVVDPLETDISKLLGRGRRITIKDDEGGVLADYIIGNKVPKRASEGGQSFYYVRKADEKAVYQAKLNIDLSTKFGDWIEADLLKLQGDNLIELMAHKYTLVADQRTGQPSFKGEEKNILVKEKPSDPWKLLGLNEEKEEVNQDEVGNTTRGLSDLKIIGARAKPEQLIADLKANKKIDPDELTWRDLQKKGFYPLAEDQFLSTEGEVEALTDAGVKYTFRFGNAFLATESELESGLEPEKKAAENADAPQAKSATTKGRYVFITTEFVEHGLGPKPTPPVKESFLPPPEKKPEPPKADAVPKTDATKPGEPKTDKPAPDEKKTEEKKPEPKKANEAKPDQPKVDEKKPEPPKADATKTEEKKPEEKKADEKKAEDKTCVDQGEAADKAAKPEAPAVSDEAKKEEPKKEEPKKEEPKKDHAKPESPKAESKADDVKKPDATPKAEPAKPDAAAPVTSDAPKSDPAAPKAENKGPTPEQQAEANFKQAQAKYQEDLKAYNDKIVAGKKKVKDLNGRFAQWYYVISEENFQKLRLSRKSLVKEKTKAEPAPGTASPKGLLPGVKLPNGILPPELTPEPGTEPEKPKTETPEKKAETKPEVKPEAKPETEKKPEAEKPATEKPADPKPDAEKPKTP